MHSVLYGDGMNNWGSYESSYGRPVYEGNYSSGYNYGRPVSYNSGWSSNVYYDQGYSNVPSGQMGYDQTFSTAPRETVYGQQFFDEHMAISILDRMFM